MKVLQLCNKAPYPANDGSSIAICSLAEGIADNDIEVHLLAINTKKHFKANRTISESFIKKTNYKSVYQNTNTNFFGALKNLFTRHSYFVSRFYFNDYKNELKNILQANKFNFVIIDGVFMATYISFIKQHTNAKIILRPHNVEHQIWERHIPNEKNKLKRLYLLLQNKRLKKFELNAFNIADAIITITNQDEKNIRQLVLQKPLHTCNTGINLTKYLPIPKPTQPNSVFHFASMDWLPNIEAVDWLLNKVWPLVIKQNSNAQLVLAGRGMPDKFNNSTSKNILVIDNVHCSKLFYETYDIMLVPLWSGSGLRIKLVEGLAYGKAIITTSIGAEGIPYSANKNMIIADTETDFANAILRLLNMQQQKESLMQQARLLAEDNFDYQLIGKKLIDFFKTLN